MPQHVANHPSLPAVTGLPDGYTVTIAGVIYRVLSGVWVAPDSGEGFDGRQVQLQASATHLQWRYEGDPVWLDLFAFSELQGDPGDPGIGLPTGGTTGQILTKTADGDYQTGWQDPPEGTIGGGTAQDGREVQLQVSATHIQWRYEGDTAWTNLVALETLRGPAGQDGTGGGGGTGAGVVFRGPWVGGETAETTIGLTTIPAAFTVTTTGVSGPTVEAQDSSVGTTAVGGTPGATRMMALRGNGQHSISIQVDYQLTVTEGQPDPRVRFADAIQSEGGYDYGRFSIDGTEMHYFSGSVAWTERNYPLTVGTHTLRWRYSKDSSASGGLDQYMVANIRVPGVASAPTYSPGDVVHHSGSSWLSVAASTAVEPAETATTQWAHLGVLAAGDSGTGLPPGGDPGQILTRVGIDGAYWADIPDPVIPEPEPELPPPGGTIAAATVRGTVSLAANGTSFTVSGIPAGATTLLIFHGYWNFSMTTLHSMLLNGAAATKIAGEYLGIGSGSSGRLISVWRYDYPPGQTAPASLVMDLDHDNDSVDMLGIQVVALSGAGEMTIAHAEGQAVTTTMPAAPDATEVVLSAMAVRATGASTTGTALGTMLNRAGNTLFGVARATGATVAWTFTGQDYGGGDNYVHVVVRIAGTIANSPNEGRLLGVREGQVAWVPLVPIPTAVQNPTLSATDGAITTSQAFMLLGATFAGAGRLRIYRTATGRADDLGRAVSTPYPGGRGLLYEYVATAAESTEHQGLVLTRLANETGVYFQLNGAAVTLSIKEIA